MVPEESEMVTSKISSAGSAALVDSAAPIYGKVLRLETSVYGAIRISASNSASSAASAYSSSSTSSCMAVRLNDFPLKT